MNAGADADPIGAAALRQCNSTLDGRGVRVAQVEAAAPGWQTNPNTISQCGQPFAWICVQGVATNFPNSIGSESGHADEVARQLLGASPSVAAIDNYEANFFTSAIIPDEQPISAKIVNQSFASFIRNVSVDQDYDDYAARLNVLFISGSGNTGRPKSPGTAFNTISVGAYGGATSIGPISDGRCKPDITAPAAYSSFATPLVSGTAAILLQAAETDDACDIRTLKALLLNGARKPAGWTNSPSSPLDLRYGAGLVNAFNSYRQLHGGKVSDPARITSRCGWDFTALSSPTNEYHFELSGSKPFCFTATLTWLRNYGQTNISNLDLLLFGANGSLIASSRSQVD
ncbi:MAG: S8 family serine peptidase, partial [Xanthobacteraceae bacterium]